jgi:hypothetical protein
LNMRLLQILCAPAHAANVPADAGRATDGRQ